jgi:recombination protein RecA
MSKNKKTEELGNDDDIFLTMAKGVGGELLEERDRTSGFVDTGILSLNFILSGKFVGGGVPIGACIEAYGGSSSGKTLFATSVLRGCQTANGIAIFLDAEHTISKEFAVKASHIDPKKMIVVEADTLEKAFAKIHKVIRMVRQDAGVPLDRPLIIVYDSIAVSPSEREFAETTIDMETASKATMKEAGAGADKPGERAKICSKEMRKLPPVLSENNATVVFINQERQKIGVLFGADTTTAGGGRALEYYCSQRIKMSSFKTIKDKLNNVIGVNVNIKNTKNKVSSPFKEVRGLRLFFNKGIDPFGGLLEVLLQDGRIEPTKPAGTYFVKEPWAGGKEIKFKSSKERNDVPSDILLDCPGLVDATDKSQIEYYINMFGSALDAVEHDIDSEVDITEDDVE